MKDKISLNTLIKSLLEEIRKLNENLSDNNKKTEFSKQSCIFLYGFNSENKVETDLYKRHVAFINNVSAVLAEFGIPVSTNGYQYIVDAVSIIIDLNNLDIKLRNDVYPYIKQKYSLNSSEAVEHSIRNAIKAAWLRCAISTVVCRMNLYEKKPTNKEFLYLVTQDVCRRMSADLKL